MLMMRPIQKQATSCTTTEAPLILSAKQITGLLAMQCDVYGGFKKKKNTDVAYKGITPGILNFIYKLGGNLYDGAFKDVADDGYYWERIRAESVYANMWTPENTAGSMPLLREYGSSRCHKIQLPSDEQRQLYG